MDSNKSDMKGNDSASSEPSHLLRLSAEWRSIIYQLVVVDNERICIGRRTSFYHTPAPLRIPSIAMTCKQIQQEVLPVFFGDNCFVYEYDAIEDVIHKFRYILQAWMRRCGRCTSLIKSVGVVHHDYVYKLVGNYDDRHYVGEIWATRYITVTKKEGGGREIVLGADMEGQCRCAFGVGKWNKLQSGEQFVPDAMELCRIELEDRLRYGINKCSTCGKDFGC